ncbi:hypothetical protein A0H81_06538 [Grifola frondosa]|uniref:Uncharacterized protein n=1 Tax=Grifola frondosa TaxID=5627 RepID=A0A1C7MAZ4_GRIFR|nr:hypothetical protein A0H81_06538 [Grifola frondosa]
MHFAQPNPQFLYREYFRYAYITTSNWLHGGRLLRVHRSPLLPSPHLLPNAPAPMNAPPNPPQISPSSSDTNVDRT